jgi:cytochrome c oxidase subunit 1
MTVSAILLGLSQFIFLANIFVSLFWGKKADMNPWHSNSVEWSAPSPPPHGNFEHIPTVYRGPYEYGHPETESDYLPQTQPGGPAIVTGH